MTLVFAISFAMFSLMSPLGARQIYFRAFLAVFSTLYVGGILFAGLSVEGWESRNDVDWAANGIGIEFGPHGLAYTDTFSTKASRKKDQGFTIEMVLSSAEDGDRSFRFIAVLHGGDDSSQLLVGQWLQNIVVMNGDDYDYRRRSPRLTADISDRGNELMFLAVKSDSNGSEVYIDGELVASRTDLELRLPTDSKAGRFVLGNSVYGRNPWSGTITAFAFHRTALDDVTLGSHREAWGLGNGFSGAYYDEAFIVYPLSEHFGRVSRNESPNGVDLHFPQHQTFIEPKLLEFRFDLGGNWRDIRLNLFGFIPFGVLLVALLAAVTKSGRFSMLMISLVLGILMSLSIEVSQAWIPSRSSSLLDVLLNSVGTAIGAVMVLVVLQSGRKWWVARGSNAGHPG